MSTEINLTTIAENVSKVHEAGKVDFMRKYQANHKRLNSCSYSFAGVGWTNENFKPVEDIKGAAMVNVFYASDIEGDLVEILEECGVRFDSSQCTNCNGFFSYVAFTRVGVVDCTKSSGAISSLFIHAYNLKTIDKLILKADGSQTINKVFTRCDSLENLTIEGVIGKNGMDVSPCPKLTVTSLLSILYALADKSGDTSGTSWVCTLGSANLAKLTDEQNQIAPDKGWTLL